MADPTPAEQTEKWDAVGEQLFAGFISAWVKSDLSKAIVSTAADVIGGVLGVAVTAMSPIGIGLAKGIANSEDLVAPALSEMASAAVSDIFGVDVPSSAFDSGMGGKSRQGAAAALGDGLINVLKGEGNSLEPSDAAAKRYLTFVVNMALEGWYQKWFFEFLSSLIPQLDVGKIENFGSLDDKMAQAIGLGRLTRRVLSPIIDTTIVEPLRWQVDKAYRPRLLTAGEAVRQFVRGRWSREQLNEELARQGYSADRIEALINTSAKFHSVTDVELFVRAGQWSIADAIRHLRDQGYEQTVAENELALEKLKRIASFERRLADAAIDAFADGRIEAFELDDFLDGATVDSQERAQMRELAEARRALRARPLSPAEARACVFADILAVSDYRDALRRDGRTEDAVLALELLLRHELDEKAKIADLREQQAAERAAERAARDELARERRAAVEADRALDRRGRESDLERAAVRGLIPLARYEEVIGARYDPDTVAILVADVEGRRVAYVAEQNRRTDAAGRAALKRLNVGQLERAVLAGELTIGEFRSHPTLQELDGADADVLTRTLDARRRDLEAARARRRELEGPAAARQIDLPRFEALVVRGIRSLDDYRGRLTAAGFAVEDVAALVELLALKLTERQAADDARRAADAEPPRTEPTVEQFRRAVVRGVRSPDDFAAFLLKRNLTPDAQRLIIDDMRAELEEVEAARARREQAETVSGAPGLSLATLERAARLGVLSLDDYRAALESRGLDELTVEVSVEMLVIELQAVAAARVRRDAIDRDLAPKRLSVVTMVRAMKAGLKTSEDLRALLVSSGYGPSDVDVQVKLAEDEVAQTKAAVERRGRIAERVSGAGVSLDALEDDVMRGARSIDAYVAELVGLGVTAAEAGVLVGLLVDRLTETAV